MAYDFFPKSVQEIQKELKSYPESTLTQITNLFNYLKGSTDTPINIDKSKPKNININRQLKSKYDVKKIQRDLKLRDLKLRFGNGSAGGRGVNNKGGSFECKFAQDIQEWWNGDENLVDTENLNVIEGLDKTYNLSHSKYLRIASEGSKNTKRPLLFSESAITLSNTKGSGYDIGKTVSDITLRGDFGYVYLSLKVDNTVTFFNVGVRTILTPDDIKKEKINNASGKRLLSLFGIDEKRFCNVFNGKTATNGVDNNAKADIANIEKLLRSGVGYGYHIIHKFKKHIISEQMNKKAMEKATSIGPVTVYYGGLTGDGKRIDMKFDSPLYSYKLNIRDTQGEDGYPTRLMCDFTHR